MADFLGIPAFRDRLYDMCLQLLVNFFVQTFSSKEIPEL
jgi:hypothetical protein